MSSLLTPPLLPTPKKGILPFSNPKNIKKFPNSFENWAVFQKLMETYSKYVPSIFWTNCTFDCIFPQDCILRITQKNAFYKNWCKFKLHHFKKVHLYFDLVSKSILSSFEKNFRIFKSFRFFSMAPKQPLLMICHKFKLGHTSHTKKILDTITSIFMEWPVYLVLSLENWKSTRKSL